MILGSIIMVIFLLGGFYFLFLCFASLAEYDSRMKNAHRSYMDRVREEQKHKEEMADKDWSV